MKHTQRIKRTQAALNARGFWLPTISWYHGTTCTFTSKEWRDFYVTRFLEYGKKSICETSVHKEGIRQRRIEKAAAKRGLSVLEFDIKHPYAYHRVRRSTDKHYQLREEGVKRDYTREFQDTCPACGGDCTEVLYWGEDGELDTLQSCQYCQGSGRVTMLYQSKSGGRSRRRAVPAYENLMAILQAGN